MQLSQIPAKIPEAFANAGSKNTIPDTSTSPDASWRLGFAVANSQPIGAGGTPPNWLDFQGILNQMSGWDQWFSAGGPIIWDSAFSTNVGGYPIGAMVQGATPGNFFVSTADNNTANPATLTNWVTLPSIILASPAITGNGTAVTQTVNSGNTTLSNTFYSDRAATNAASSALTSANNFTSTQLAQYLPLIGGALTGNLNVSRDGTGLASQLSISGDAGTNRVLNFETGGVLRAQWALDNEAESGAAAGSNVVFGVFTNAGVLIANIVKIFRNTQIWQFLTTPIVPNLGPSDASFNVPNTNYVDRQALINNLGPMTVSSGTGVTIGASFNQNVSFTFTPATNGTVYATGFLNVSLRTGVGICAANVQAILTINGTGPGDNLPLSQGHQAKLTVTAGTPVTVQITVTTTADPVAKGTYSCGATWVPTL